MTTLKRFLTLVIFAALAMQVRGEDKTITWTASAASDLGSTIAAVNGTATGTINTTNGVDSYAWDYTRTLKSGEDYMQMSSGYIQLGKNGGVENVTFTTSAIPGTIKSVSVDCSSYNNAHKVSITVGSTSYLASTATAKWTATSIKTGTGTSSGTITISFTSGTRALYVKSISVTYNNDGGGCTDPTTLLSITNANTATVGIPLSLTTDGGNGSDVTWSIVSGGSYASLTGSTLTPTAAGTVRVQASQGESSGKCGATLTQDITISTAPIDVTLHYKGTTATLDDQINPYTLPTTGIYVEDACDEWKFAGWYGGEYGVPTASETKPTYITQMTSTGDAYAVYQHTEGGSSGETYNFTQDESISSAITIATGVTATFSIGSGSSSPTTEYENAVRVYANNTITIQGTGLTRIAFTYTGSKAMTPSVGSISAGVWTGSADEVTFTVESGKGNNKISAITVGGGGTTTYSTNTDCRDCAEPTLTFGAPTEVTKFADHDPFTKTAILGGSYPLNSTITYSSDKPGKASVNATTGEVTIYDATSTEPVTITATVAAADDGIICQKKVTASYTLNIYNRVTWLVNGASYSAGAPTTQTVEGGSIEVYPTDPDGSIVCGGKTFVGWTTAPYAESDTKPTTLYTSLSDMSGVHITDNTTFYAVFAEETISPTSTTYSIVGDYEEDFESGEDYVIANYYNSTDKALNATVTGTYYLTGTTVTIPSSNTFQTSNGRLVWKITTEGTDQVSLYNEETGKYAYLYHPSGTYYDLGLRDEKYIWTISNVKETGEIVYFTLTASDYPSYILAWDNSNSRYAAKTTNNGYLYFYKKTLEYTFGAYSTTCGPNIKASDPEWLTSTKDQTVKSEAITIKGSNLTGETLSVKGITGADAAYFSCTLASSTITAGVIETTYVISYTPTIYGDAQHTATLIFTDGTTDSDPITLHGRSLPQKFAIVAYDGANYYALDGFMTGEASTVKPLPITVTAGVVDKCPTRAIYGLTDQDTPSEYIHFISTTGRLYGAGSGTGLNIHSFTAESGTGWHLITRDFSDYHIINATTTTRAIMYNSTYDVFGHYSTNQYSSANYYGDILLLPIDEECTCLNKPVVTCVAKSNKATLTWEAVEGAIGYEITCSGGIVTSPVTDLTTTITGLSNNTNYTYTVKAIASGTDCSLVYNGTFKTTNCDDVPYDIFMTPGIKSVTVKWKMEAANATIRIYADEECSDQVGTDHTGLTSPATISGLNENTTYYLKIWAGGTCVSAVKEFLTNSTSVEVAEWFTNGINIIIDADANASVIIEDKKEHGSESGNVADKLFISKYFEADGNNKMIAIYNGTPDPIDITDMWLYRSEINASEKKICLKKFGKIPGTIAPNEEIIIMRYTNDSDPAKTCAEKEDNYDEWNIINSTNKSDGEGNDIYTWLQFSGPQSIGLYDGSTNKFIDVIGATTNNTGTGKLVQIYASNSISCSYTENSNNDGSGFFANGKEVETDNDIVLSTNRCLLIRKNTVKSGDDAVANNVYVSAETPTHQACDATIGHAFTTLGSEWVGYIIGKGSDAAQKTCEGLAWVGGFDYQNYYTTYDSISGLKTLDGNQNEDGTYTIPIPQLDTLSCTMMRIKVYEGTTEKASREYKVPIMIDAAATTKDDKYFHSYARETNSADVCRECDVVILGSGTLTKASSDEAKDIPEIHNLTIYPGGTLVVPEGPKYEYTVNSIQFRVQGEQSPVAKLKGNLITNDGQVLVSRRINNSRYYFFSLPYDCNIDEVRWSNGTPATNGVDYRIAEYDSETRAAEGSTKGAPGHYKQVTGNTLKAGVGYVIATNDRYLKELVFPMDIGSTNLTTAENTKTTNKVALHQYTGSSSINNHNWNLIAHPYVSAFNAYEDAKITAGWLKCTTPATPDNPDGGEWEYVDAGNVYLTMPSYNTDKTTYTQTLSSTVGTINPFLAVFVQAAGEGDLTFDPGDRILSAPARHLAAQAEKEDESIFVGVTLSGNGQSDQTNLRIRPDFTDEYQLGYDLLKFTTYYTARPQIFMKTPSHQLAFQAVNDSVAKSCFLPMGVYCEYAGSYTFALDEHYPIDEVEAVYLYDKTTGTTTNLLYDTYTITTSGRINTTSRFSLNVWLNRKAPQITTGIDGVEAPDGITRKILINDHVYIQRGGAIYDVTGKEVFNF